MSPQEVIEKMNLRFQSGNSVPVESSRITKEEWDVVKSLLKDESDGLAKQETNKQLREERDAEVARVTELEKDAARYRYIKKGGQWIVAATQTGAQVDGGDLDALIDSEMEQS